jgi:hypothetical protein
VQLLINKVRKLRYRIFVCVQGAGRSIARMQPPAHVTNRGMTQLSLTAVSGIRQQ